VKLASPVFKSTSPERDKRQKEMKEKDCKCTWCVGR